MFERLKWEPKLKSLLRPRFPSLPWTLCVLVSIHFVTSLPASIENKTDQSINQSIKDPNVLLVYSTWKSIRVFNLNDSTQYSIVENRGQNVGIAVDIRNRKVLWTDVSDKREAIYRRSIDGNGTIETVVDYGIQLVEGLAFDWITGNIYFIDAKKKHIVACSNDGYQCTILITEILDRPREIALHPNEGYMFWSSWGDKGLIIKSQMDGRRAKPIVDTNLHWPNGLVIDHANARLYWSDAKSDLIETVDLNGDDRRVVRSAGNGHFFSLDLFGDTLYWSDWQANEIHSCNKSSGKDVQVVVHEGLSPNRMSQLHGLSIFHPAAQPKTRRNQCLSAGCLHMCMLAPNNSSTCACPTGMNVDASGKGCIDDDRTAKIVIGHQNQLGLYEYGSIGRNLIEEIPLREKTQIGAVHYNAINETIFISDMFWHKIYEYSPRTKKMQTIVSEHLDSVTGLSLDVIGQNLYWTDYSRQKIEVFSLRTKARAVISSEKSDFPQDLVVVPEKKVLFVAMSSSRWGRIIKMNMNGYNRSTIAKISRGEPASLTYNRELERVFWCDIYKESIEHTSLNGFEQATAVKSLGAFSISSFRNHIYWTDRRTQLLHAMTVLGSDFFEKPVFIGNYEDRQNTTLTSYLDGNFLAKISILQKDLHIYDQLLERHECSVTRRTGATKCSHICLMSNDDYQGTCLCPDGMELEPDLSTCLAKCYPDQFQCKDKKCVAGDFKCDGYHDCSEGEDEVGCVKTTMCEPTDFECLLKESEAGNQTSTDDGWWEGGPKKPQKEKTPPKEGNGSVWGDDVPEKERKDGKRVSSEKPQRKETKTSFSREEIRTNQREDNDDDRTVLRERAVESQPKEGAESGSNTVTVVVITVVLLLLIVTIIIGFILHKRRISPKTLVQPYVQQLVKYVNRPVQRWQDNNGGNKREQFSNEVVYDETFDTMNGIYGSGQFANPTYEEIDNLHHNEWNRNNSDSSKGESSQSRSADSGILTVMDTDTGNLYEDVDDHFITFNQKQKLIADEKDYC